jgi:hypothetical protein
MSYRFSRRRWLRLASQTGAALAVPYFGPGRALGAANAAPPSERITMGVIGAGLRGTQNLGYFANMGDASGQGGFHQTPHSIGARR